MKPGYRTTEFWVAIVVQLIGMGALMGWFTPEQSTALTEASTQIGGIVAMVASAFGYSISRGMAKKNNGGVR